MELPLPNFGHKIIIIIISVFMTLTLSRSFVSAILLPRIHCPVNSIYKLGDSLADTGNYIRLFPTAPASRLPYGETFPKFPTGRWSDGQLMIDFLAKSVGLPLLKPYLSHNTLAFQHGVNFAVASSTALDTSYYSSQGIVTEQVPSLQQQLKWFKAHLKTICLTPAGCKIKLSRSIVFIGEFGANDIRYVFNERKSVLQVANYLSMARSLILATTRDILSSGASQVVVPGLFPFGCFPFIRDFAAATKGILQEHDEYGCLKDLNNVIESWNVQLQVGLEVIRKEYPFANILYMDIYNPFVSLLRSAPTLGFSPLSLLEKCCGGKEIQYQVTSPKFCGNLEAPVCPNPSKFIYWDGIHLTEAAYRYIADHVILDLGFHCPAL